MAKSGDIEGLKELIQGGYPVKISLFSGAAKRMNLDMCDYLVSLEKSVAGIRIVGLIACRFGSFRMLDWALEKDMKINSLHFTIAASNGHLDIIKYLKEKGGIHDSKPLCSAARSGHVDVLLWFLENESRLDKAPALHIWNSNYNQIVQVFHDYKIPGHYQRRCDNGKCNSCRVDIVWDEWILKNPEYDNYIQMLPQELVEDLRELILC